MSSHNDWPSPVVRRCPDRSLNLTCAPLGGGDRICPVLVFQNNPKTVVEIDTKFGVPYPPSIWHQMTKFCRNRQENVWEIYVFVGLLHASFDQNQLNVKKFAKNKFLKQTTQKERYRCKITRSTKSISRNFEFLTPQNIEKTTFLGKHVYVESKLFRHLKTRTYNKEPYFCYLHVNFKEIHPYLVP